MDERIEAFLLDVLEDEGKDSNVVRANTRCYLALYIEMFRAESRRITKRTWLPRDVAIGAASVCWKNLINARALRPQTICGSF